MQVLSRNPSREDVRYVLCPWAITLPATTATHPCRIATTEFAASLAAAEINCWSLMLIDVVMVMGIIQILILVCFNFKSAESTPFGVTDGWTYLGGFSDKVFRYLDMNKDALSLIELMHVPFGM